MSECRPFPKEVKSVLRRNALVEAWFLARATLAPYQGCGHGCVYCDGRAEKYHVEGDFAADITVRTNVREVLSRELRLLREKGFLSIGSGTTDVYQPLEARYGLTRACLEEIAARGLALVILTKSALIRRDLDLLAEIARKSACVVFVSLAFLDEELRRVFEPGASPVAERLETLRLLKGAGCRTVMLAMPRLPGLADDEASFDALVKAAAAVGCDAVMPGGLTLRPGRQKDLYFETLRSYRPGLEASVGRLYAENRASGNTIWTYRQDQYPMMARVLKENGMPPFLPHGLWRDAVNSCDEVHILLCHMRILYGGTKGRERRLDEALGRYVTWLSERRRVFNRNRKLSPDALDLELRERCEKNGDLESLLGNEKLAKFVRQVVLEGKILDYLDLSLR